MHNFYSQECHSQARSVGKRDSLPSSTTSNSTASTSGSATATATASNDTTTTAKKGLPWWKLARPTRLGRRRSLAELSANSSCVCRTAREGGEMPSSGQGLFSAERTLLPSSPLTSLSSCYCSARSEKRQQPTQTVCANMQQLPQNLSCSASFGSCTESMGVPSSPEVEERGAHDVAHGGVAEPSSTAAAVACVSTSWVPAYSSGSKRSKAAIDNDHPYEQQLSDVPSGSTLVSESARKGQAEDSDHDCRTQVDDISTDPRSPKTPSKSSVCASSSPDYTATSTVDASAAGSTPPSGVSDARRNRVVAADSLKSMTIAPGDTAMISFDYKKREEGLDDETALSRPCRPRVVYDILAVDRGCGNCDTSVVPFPLNDGGRVSTGQMRAVAAGQGDFLARRWRWSCAVSFQSRCDFRWCQWIRCLSRSQCCCIVLLVTKQSVRTY